MNADKLIKLGIDLRGKWSGEIKTKCPKCAHSRKKQNDPSLSVNIDEGVWKCHHCHWSGSVNQYVRPEPRQKLQTKGIIDTFDARKISQATLDHFGVTEGVEWMPQDQKEHKVICFNYFMDGELVNIKFKTANKMFKMVKDARKIPYNIDAIKDSPYVVVTEGEEEVMVWHQSSKVAISVPNGATEKNNNLEWLDSVYDLFEGKIIYLATDNDAPGRKLRDDLARRFPSHDIRIIEFPESQKDSNDCLKIYGQDFVTRLFEEAKPLPIAEISSAADYLSVIQGYHKDGYPVGELVNMSLTDEHMSWSRGELAVITGIPNMGKSTWLDYMFVRLAYLKNWKFGCFCPENTPPLKITRMSEQLMGKSLTAMNSVELERAVSVIDKYFWFYNIEILDDYSLPSLLNLGQFLVKRHGIDCLCLDPFNYIEQDKGDDSTTEKIGALLRILKMFAVKNNVLVVLVAHPRKMERTANGYNVPRLYDVSGSHHFYNVPDWGGAIHRTYVDGQNDITEFHVQKMKWHFRGKLGSIQYSFDRATGQYSEDGAYKPIYNEKIDIQADEHNLFSSPQAWGRGIGIQPKPES